VPDPISESTGSTLVSRHSLGLAHPPTVLLRRFLEIRDPFHVSDQTFFFTELLETSDHLLDGFACPGLDLQHSNIPLSKKEWPFCKQTDITVYRPGVRLVNHHRLLFLGRHAPGMEKICLAGAF